MAYDIVIKNGTIIDGTGAEGYRGGVAITGTKIVLVGQTVPEDAKIVIDAANKVVCPGFIDVTNHSDTVGTLFSIPSQESMLRQGVTTIIGGNCGSSLAPLTHPNIIAAVQKWQTDGHVAVDWLSMGQFFDAIEKLKLGVNFGSFVGFGILRRGILENKDRALMYQDITKMKFVLGEALKEGALGLSTGLVYAHERKTSTEELIDLASVIYKEGGIYKTHLRSESGDLLGAVNEAIAVGREAGVPICISHFKAIGRKAWREYHRALELLDRAAESGVTVHFDMYPYITTGSFLYLLLPMWAYEGGFKQLFTRLKEAKVRQEIIKALQKKTLHHSAIIIATAWKTKESIGRSIQELSDKIGIPPEEVIAQLLLANEGRVTIFGKTVRKDHVREGFSHRLSIVASDGSGYDLPHRERGELVHPRSFGAFPRFIRLATKKWKTLDLPAAIHKATAAPAEIVGIPKRGVLAKDNFADIVVFDPDAIQSSATFQNPYQFPRGIEWVIVNGKVSIRAGILQNERHGMVLRRGRV